MKIKLLHTDPQFTKLLYKMLKLTKCYFKISHDFLRYKKSDKNIIEKTYINVCEGYNTNKILPPSFDFILTSSLYTTTQRITFNNINDNGSVITDIGYEYYIIENNLNVPYTPYDVININNPDYSTNIYEFYLSIQEYKLYVIRGYVTNSAGTTYSSNILFTKYVSCLAEGTLITLSDYTTKPIENIRYTDKLLVWDFDNGKFSEANPIFIQKKSIHKNDCYNLLKFDDGSTLKTILKHRIFNKQKGEFTYTNIDTPIGTETFTSNGKYVKLISKEIINEPVHYYNVFTEKHINIFANNILTSCRLNNMYPIVDMKFQNQRSVLALKSSEKLLIDNGIPEYLITGLRLTEQKIENDKLLDFVNSVIIKNMKEIDDKDLS
jgi:hypothetical protein